MREKFLSVYIPNYNHARYLPDCINSVLKEAPENTEILVIDDASTDHSVAVIQELVKKDQRVRFLQNKTNKGANATLHLGLHEVTGKYCLALSADDKLLPGFLIKNLEVLHKNKDLGLCCSDYAYFYDTKPDEIKINKLLKIEKPYLIMTPEESLKAFRKTSFWIPGHTTIARTEYARKYGGYQEKIRQSSDFFLFHKIALNHPIGYIPQGLSAMRLLPQSYSAQCLADPKVRNQAARNLLDLILSDESKELFQKSTLLNPILKRTLIQTVLTPKYWGFLWPAIGKKLGLFNFRR